MPAGLHWRLRDDWRELLWYLVCGVLQVLLYLRKNIVRVPQNKRASHL